MVDNPALDSAMFDDSGGAPTDRPGFARTWWVALRPFALPASTMPVVFGTVLALTHGQARFDPLLF